MGMPRGMTHTVIVPEVQPYKSSQDSPFSVKEFVTNTYVLKQQYVLTSEILARSFRCYKW